MNHHIEWTERKTLSLLDQRKLPSSVTYLDLKTPVEVADAIADMVVRGAPAIGIVAAYGLALCAIEQSLLESNKRSFHSRLVETAKALKDARPTAINLAWAVDRQLKLAHDLLQHGAMPEDVASALEEEALQIHRDDVVSCRAIGKNGLALVPDGATILTHCNAGALATGGYGTALGVVRTAHEAGKGIKVLADETRPFLQGARLTAWELQQDNIPVTVICDNAAGVFMARGEVDLVVVGADRISANGDTANKIGTYSLAVLAARHGIPFYVAAPHSTFDLKTRSGDKIPIESRSEEEVLSFEGIRVAPKGVHAFNPAFDVTPHDLISAIITEHGIVKPVNSDTIQELIIAKRP